MAAPTAPRQRDPRVRRRADDSRPTTRRPYRAPLPTAIAGSGVAVVVMAVVVLAIVALVVLL